MRFPEMVLDAIMTSQHPPVADNQSKHFFRLLVQGTILKGVGVKIPEPFHHKIVFTKNDFVHPGTVIIKFFN
jgi:hypothetical protein